LENPIMSKHSTLPTALQVALKRAELAARAVARREAAAERARRFDPSAYRCRREGATWIAEGPAGNTFRFRKGAQVGDALCLSGSGGEYVLTADEEGIHCSCPDAAQRERATGCKHAAAFRAVMTTCLGQKAKEEQTEQPLAAAA
jgi:hypothetical protein